MRDIADVARNLAITVLSLACWVFSLLAMATIVGSSVGAGSSLLQLVRTLMNVNASDIQDVVRATGLMAAIGAVYLLPAGYVNRLRRRESTDA